MCARAYVRVREREIEREYVCVREGGKENNDMCV